MTDIHEDLRKVNLPFDIDTVHEQCIECVRKQLKKYEKHMNRKGERTAGKFLVPCSGIPKDPIDPAMKATVTDDVWDEMQAVVDIVKWADKYLKLPNGESWTARWYQAKVLRCTSRRKMLRIARRTGKTDLVCIEICYYLFTEPNIKIVVAGPQKTHTEEIITRVRAFIKSNPVLQDLVSRDVSAPYYEMKLTNGARLRGFAAGTKGKGEGISIRGQDADRLYLEEMDYIDQKAINGAVLPLLSTSPHTALVGFSTPSGFQTPYYKFCTENPHYVEFMFNYKVLPHWKNVEMERSSFTEEEWTHEYLAEWGSSEDGVYKPEYIDRALQPYKYEDHKKNPAWRYCIGTDWNEKHGTEIVVVGYNTLTSRYQVVEAMLVAKSEFTQLSGVQALLDMNKKWKPSFIYIDAGNGCLYKDSLVYTNTGIKEIQAICEGDQVLTHTGNFKEVISAVPTGIKKSYFLKPAFCLKTKVSKKHKHMVYRSKNKFNDFNWTVPTYKVSSLSLDFIELKTEELDKDLDFLIVPKQQVPKQRNSLIVDLVKELDGVPNLEYDREYIWTTNSYDTSPVLSIKEIVNKYGSSRSTIQRIKRKLKDSKPFSPSERRLAKRLSIDYGENWYLTENKKISRYIDILDPGFLDLYGWYLSEGHAGINNIEISQMPFHYQKEFSNLISYCSQNWDTNVITRKNGMRRLFILSSLLAEFFKRIGGSSCYNKFIDQRIIDNNGYELLPSLFWGDGHEHLYGINISLTSYTLVMQTRQMLINNGLLPGLHKILPRKRNDGEKESAPQLMLYLNANKLNVDKINNILKTSLKARDGIYRRKYIELSDCFLTPIKKLDNIGEVEDMYDLTIVGDHSFCVNGFATHNSTNYELLRKTAYQQCKKGGDRDTAKLLEILRKYDAGSSLKIKDPITSAEIRSPAKPFMVNASVRKFEQGLISISSNDQVLEKQLRSYIIERMTPTKVPVYGLEEPRVGDHRLDALHLALVAFQLEFNDLHVINVLTTVGAVPDPRTKRMHFREDASLDNKEHRPEDRRLSNLNNNSTFGSMPARIDNGRGILKTNRPGWDTDREELFATKHLQRKRSRGSVSRGRPSRTNF